MKKKERERPLGKYYFPRYLNVIGKLSILFTYVGAGGGGRGEGRAEGRGAEGKCIAQFKKIQ